MAQTAKSIIISKFEAGDRPTDQDFLNLFDSILFINNVGSHANGLNTANTSIEGNFTIQGDLAIAGSSTLSLGTGFLSIGNAAELVNSPYHGYTHQDEPVMYASASISDVLFLGISGDSTSSIKLEDDTDFAQFGTHTGKAFISVAGSEYFNITSSNLGPHSFFSGSVGIGSAANADAAEKFKIFDADTNVSAYLQTSKTNGIASIGFENDSQIYTFGVRGNDNDNLTIVNATGTPFKIKSNATTDNLVLDGGKVGIGTESPLYPLQVESTTNTVALFKTTDDGPTHIHIDTNSADTDTHSAIHFLENGSIKGATGYNAENDTINLLYSAGINNTVTNGINIDQNGNIGIGTHSPENKLDVIDTISDVVLRLKTEKTDGSVSLKFENDVQKYLVGVEGPLTDGSTDKFVIYDATYSTTPFKIENNATTDTLVLTDNGKVGIGTNLPATTLDVRGDISIGATPTITLYDNDNVTNGPDILFNGHALLAANGDFNINIDSDGDNDNNKFSIRVDGDTNAASELFYVSSSGQVSASGGFIGDGSQLTGITGGQLQGFVTTPGDNRLITSNATGDAVIGEANLIFDGTNLGVGTTPGVLLDLEGDGDAAKLRITSTGTSLPAKTAHIELIGYDGRAKGILFNDSTLPDDHWFVGTPYVDVDGESFQIGYDGATAQPEYLENAKLYVSASGHVGIGTSTPTEKLTVNGNLTIKDGVTNVIKFQNDNSANTKADILFNASGVITAEDGLIMAINSTGGNANFQIRTGDPQLGGEGVNETELIASFGTGSIGRGLVLPGSNASMPQILFQTDSDFDANTTGSDAARIKFTHKDSEGNDYVSNTADFLVFEKLDSDQTSPDGGILFTNNGGDAGSSPETVSMAIRGTGEIGIGTVSPDFFLDIDRSNGAEDLGITEGDEVNLFRLSYDSSNNSQLLFTALRTSDGSDHSTSGTRIQAKTDATWQGYVQFNGDGNNHGISFGGGSQTTSANDTVELMRIEADGNVGIGTINPSNPLHVRSDNDFIIFAEATNGFAGIKLEDVDTTTLFNGIFVEGNDLGFRTNNVTRFRFDENHHIILNLGSLSGVNSVADQVKLGDNEVSLQIQTEHGTIQMGMQNPSFNHFKSEATHGNYFREGIIVDDNSSAGTLSGKCGIESYADDLYLFDHAGKSYIQIKDTTIDMYADDVQVLDIGEGSTGVSISGNGTHTRSNPLGLTSSNIKARLQVKGDHTTNDSALSLLDVVGTGQGDALIHFGQGYNAGGFIYYRGDSTSDSIFDGMPTGDTIYYGGNASNNGNVIPVMSHRYHIQDANFHGKLGIGLSDDGSHVAPSYPLHVKSSNDFIIFAESTDSFAGIKIADVDTTTEFNGIFVDQNILGLRTDNITALQINSTQDVAIGGSPVGGYELTVYNGDGNSDLLLRSRGGNGEAYFQSDCNANTDASGMLMKADNVVKGFAGYYDGGTRIGAGTGPSSQKGIYIKSGSAAHGVVGINTITPNPTYATLEVKQLSAFRGLVIENDDTTDFWNNWYGNSTSDVTFGSNANQLIWSHNGAGQNGGWINSVTTGYNQMFTGQHRNIPDTGEVTDYMTKIGYIVSSNGIIQNVPSEDISTHEVNRPNINESLPQVKLSDVPNDKKVYGVISDLEDPESSGRSFMHGNWGSMSEKPEGDDRLIINSVGEGAIMVCDINGNLENGDYITTSEIPGIGMKQNDDLLHNYTVAKIVQDCDFTNNEQYMISTITHNGVTYKTALVGCTYHCG